MPVADFSTKVSVLEELEEENPIIKEILAYRELQKLLSTYIDVIPKMVGKDGRLHAKFITKRHDHRQIFFSRSEFAKFADKNRTRKKNSRWFCRPKGSKLCAFDYSQIELRVAAMLSGDKKMTQIFREKKDIHAGVASFVFGVPMEKVDSEMRRRAKVINFGIIYGMGVSALRKNLGGTREEAQKFYDNYFNQFSGVRDYLEEVKKFAHQKFLHRNIVWSAPIFSEYKFQNSFFEKYGGTHRDQCSCSRHRRGYYQAGHQICGRRFGKSGTCWIKFIWFFKFTMSWFMK